MSQKARCIEEKVYCEGDHPRGIQTVEIDKNR